MNDGWGLFKDSKKDKMGGSGEKKKIRKKFVIWKMEILDYDYFVCACEMSKPFCKDDSYTDFCPFFLQVIKKNTYLEDFNKIMSHIRLL